MHLALDICQGIGVAAAVGIRPFLPALVVGALAAGDVELHVQGTDYSFLRGVPFLLAMVLLTIVVAFVQRRWPKSTQQQRGPFTIVLALAGLALGALLFAGALQRGHNAAWPGWIGGVLCAAVALAATMPLIVRVRGRMEQSIAATLPIYVEAVAVLFAALSVLAPPVGPIGLLVLLWLLVAGRGREQQKYAGLRILR
ncbi:MAG: hypothetical protein ABSG43_00935 [Solirubrobacteraceae bacterium]|jgi:hypothetical protein